jgi:hypothetical protein
MQVAAVVEPYQVLVVYLHPALVVVPEVHRLQGPRVLYTPVEVEVEVEVEAPVR